MSKRLLLIRDYFEEATIGRIINEDGVEICKTLERPVKYKEKENLRDNPKTKINESCCIPEGDYEVRWTFSPTFKRYTFQIIDVPMRSGIRIHKANKVSELFGCIAPVVYISENGDEKYYGFSSGLAEDRLVDEIGILNKFILKIVSNQTLCKI